MRFFPTQPTHWIALTLVVGIALHLAVWSNVVYVSRKQVLWVSPEGSAIGAGTRERPCGSVRCALRLARSGDEVRLLPGTYYERLRVGSPGASHQPLRLVAHEPGTVVISGHARPSDVYDLQWTPLGDGIFRTHTDWPIYQVRVDGRYAFQLRWSEPDDLRRLADRPEAHDAFLWTADGNLYLFLQDGATPESSRLSLNGRVPSPREWGNVRSANIRIEGGHVVLEGLRLEGGVGAGVHVWEAESLVLRDSIVEGASVAVDAMPSIRPADRILIERSVYHNYPQGNWVKSGWLSWAEVYATYSSSTLVASPDAGVEVAGSLVAHYGDGVRVSPSFSGAGARITNSVFFMGTDDAFELDGPAVGVQIRHNLVFEAHESLSFSPLTTGPVEVRHNLFLHPEGGLNGASLKFLPPEQRADRSIRNLSVLENVFVGNWLCWHQVPVVDSTFMDNTIVMRNFQEPPLPEGLRLDLNRVAQRADLQVDPLEAPEDWRPVWWTGVDPGPSWMTEDDLPFLSEMNYRVPAAWLEHDDARLFAP